MNYKNFSNLRHIHVIFQKVSSKCIQNTHTALKTPIPVLLQIFKVLLDLKECLDSILLMYNEEDSDCPVLTTNALKFGQKSKEHR